MRHRHRCLVLVASLSFSCTVTSVQAQNVLNGANSTASPPIKVRIQASWQPASLVVQILETVALEAPTAFFPILSEFIHAPSNVSPLDNHLTPKDVYDRSIALLENSPRVSPSRNATLEAIKLSLALHEASPRIQTHHQLHSRLSEPQRLEEQSIVVLSASSASSLTDLNWGSTYIDESSDDLFDFDHVYPAFVADVPLAILYADPHSANFAGLHQRLVMLTSEGKLRYVLRWKPSARGSPHSFSRENLAGFGAALDLKRIDYLTIDDRDISSDSLQNLESNLEAGKTTAIASCPGGDVFDEVDGDNLVQLKPEQIDSIGMKAAQFIASAGDPLHTMLRLTSDFPKYAHMLAAGWVPTISKGVIDDLRALQSTTIDAGRNLFILNGMQLSEKDLKPFTLLRLLRNERKIVSDIISLVDSGRGLSNPITPALALKILTHPAMMDAAGDTNTAPGALTAAALGEMFDASDRAESGPLAQDSDEGVEASPATIISPILYWNDLTRDSRYKRWTGSLNALLQPLYAGQMPQVRRNLFNVVYVVRLDRPETHALLAGEVAQMVSRGISIRFGFVPAAIGEDEQGGGLSAVIAKALWHLVDTAGRSTAIAFSRDLSELDVAQFTPENVAKVYAAAVRSWHVRQKEPPSDVVIVDYADLQSNDLQNLSPVAAALHQKYEAARAYNRRLGLQMDMSSDRMGSVFVNGKVFPMDESYRHNLQSSMQVHMQYLQQQVYMGTVNDDTDVENYFYDLPSTYKSRNAWIFPDEERPLRFINLVDLQAKHGDICQNSKTEVDVSIFVLVDVNSAAGQDFADAAMWQTTDGVRVCVVHQTLDNASLHPRVKISTGIWTAAVSAGEATHLGDKDSTARLAEFAKVQAGKAAIIINGRVIDGIEPSSFGRQDFAALIAYERSKRVRPAQQALNAALPSEKSSRNGDLIAKLTSVLSRVYTPDAEEGLYSRSSLRRSMEYKDIEAPRISSIVGDEDNAVLQIGVVLDPLSDPAQSWSAILKSLSSMSSVVVRLYLNPRLRTELPLRRFYRHSLPHCLQFDDRGIEVAPSVVFNGIPQNVLLTLAMEMQHAWQAFPRTSVHDLDNIRLSDLKPATRLNGIDAIFELSNIIVEGHAREAKTGAPPRGLQLLLQSGNSTVDTLVMANLGYHQFKANPGIWNLSVRAGRSSEVFELGDLGYGGAKQFPLSTFEGVTMYPKFARRPGMEGIDLLDDEGKETSSGSDSQSVFSSLKRTVQSFFGRSKTPGITDVIKAASTGAQINIFTVASGLLYERMAMLMILSVLRHTKSTVKFWFINNFLSPSFKAFIPHLAREYGFDYELVTYTWPPWLRAQKEKQRTIWGYKILFLDVLFPLELERVIFVDSDQIVRTDLQQLIDADLHGAPYGFTPMGDDRVEMEGFRFWKTGYWREHLRGRPYHISALYVVDLDRFRQIAAGDRLRAQYQALSSDPHSLANLDQDLPNNMQTTLPIHTLDKSWLWCETWCSDESLKDAKTIDLCNNPMTHEPKLARAKRLIPEWTVYDKEIADLAARVNAETKAARLFPTNGGGEDSGDGSAAEAFADEVGQLEQARMQQKEFVEEGTGNQQSERKVEVSKEDKQSLEEKTHTKDEL